MSENSNKPKIISAVILIICAIVLFILSFFIFPKFIKNTPKETLPSTEWISWSNVVDNEDLGNTTQSQPIQPGIIETWKLDIDRINDILSEWKEGEDYEIIIPNKQFREDWRKEWDELERALDKSAKTVRIPADIIWWYLYIKLNKPLIYIEKIKTYQPLQIKQSKLQHWNRRLKTDESLYLNDYSEFLYTLDYIPVRNTAETDRLKFRGQDIKVGMIVGDDWWNYVEQMIFFRLR